MRSLARLFSSSRRAPPNAASKPYLSSACFSPSVFHMSVCSGPWSNGLIPCGFGFGVLVDDELDRRVRRDLVAQRIHVAELPRRIDVQQRERQRAGEERLLRQVQHHRRILADRIEHHRLVGLGDRLAQDVDALGLEPVEMGQSGRRRAFGISLQRLARFPAARKAPAAYCSLPPPPTRQTMVRKANIWRSTVPRSLTSCLPSRRLPSLPRRRPASLLRPKPVSRADFVKKLDTAFGAARHQS